MGRNVLISGASHGIGAATAIAFAKDGCNVGINYHNNRAGAEETAAECRKYGVDAQIYCADIGCREQAVGMMRDFDNEAVVQGVIDKAVAEFGRIDVLINNAGGALKMPKGEFCDMPLDYWDSQIALNLSGAAYLSHEAIKNMKEHNIPGRIVNISSIHGSVTWVKRKALPYCAGKGGIEMFTKTLAIEVAKYGIRVNCVAPGAIDTHRRDEPLFRSRRRGLPAQDRRGIPRNAGGYRADDTVLRGCGKDKIHRRADDRGRWRTEHRRRDRLYAQR